MPRSRPEGTKFPAYSGGFLIDDFRGQRRVRKWPRKRGRPKSELVREQNDWFKAVTQIIKLAAPEQTVAAMDATKGQGVYPRDLLMHTISEGIMDITELDGTFVQHRRPRVDGVAFQGARLERINTYTVTVGAPRIVIWETPILDTAAMWDIANPTVLTVPIGVTVMEFYFGAHSSQFPNTLTRMWVRRLGGPSYSHQAVRSQAGQATNLSTGPLAVVAGQEFVAEQWNDATMNFIAGALTYFSAQILGTT